MGTIVDKFNYSFEAKDLIKDSINNLGGSITSETELKEYAQELDNIYDNLPKTTGEGTSLSLTTLKGKMNLIPKGDTEQDSTKGDNFANCNGMNSLTQNGITFTINKDSNGSVTSIKLNGTCTNYSALCIGTVYTIKAGTYVLYGNGVTNNIVLQVLNDTASSQIEYVGKDNRTLTLNADTNIILRLSVSVGATLNNVEIYPMIATTSGKDFEPYTNGASPNPTYPQNIEVVTGTQNVKVSGNEFAEIETQTLNDMKITKTDNGYILNGTASANTTFRATITNPTNSNKTLCVKCDTAITNANVQVKTRNSSAGQLRSISLSTANVWEVLSGTFEDYYCDIYVKSGTTLSNVLVQPMLLEGTFTTSNLGKYQPYNEEQTQIVSLGDIELSKIGTYQDYLYKTSGKNLANEDNIVVGKAWNLSDSNDRAIWNIACKPNTTYTLSYASLGSITNVYINEKTSTTSTDRITYVEVTTSPKTITTSSTTNYLTIQFNKTSISLNDIKAIKLMLNEGSTALPYEPYGSGKWYKKEQIKHYTITGEEGWNDSGITGVAYINTITNYATSNNIPYCTHFKGENNSNGAGGMQDYGNNTIAFMQVSGSVTPRLYIKKTGITTTELRTLLQEIKPVLYYALETPNDIEITNSSLIEQLDNLEKLKSYNGVTNISSSGSLPMILNISAIKGE